MYDSLFIALAKALFMQLLIIPAALDKGFTRDHLSKMRTVKYNDKASSQLIVEETPSLHVLSGPRGVEDI